MAQTTKKRSIVHNTKQPYTRITNGRAVTVRAHTQVDEAMSHAAGIHHRPHLAVPRGSFLHGLAPSGAHPAQRDTPNCPPSIFQRVTAAQMHQVPLAAVQMASELLMLAAAEDWTTAVHGALDFILTVMTNNTHTEMPEILSRPDVQGALHDAGQEGAQAAIQAISATWIQHGGEPDSSFLISLLGDMARNGNSFPQRMTDALLHEPHDRVEQIILKDRLRAAAAEAVAETRARAEAELKIMRSNGVTHVKWVAKVDDRTCSGCLALNGTVVPIGTQFPHDAGGLSTPVYHDLIAPPRHPNCRCRLVPVAGGKTK